MLEIHKNISANQDKRTERFDQMDYLQTRMEMLKPIDRVMLELYYWHNVTFQQLSYLSGLSPTTVSRRIESQIKRLLGKRYIAIYRKRRFFLPEELQVAYDHFLLGMGYRSIAAKQNITPSRSRKIIKKLNDYVTKEKLRQSA